MEHQDFDQTHPEPKAEGVLPKAVGLPHLQQKCDDPSHEETPKIHELSTDEDWWLKGLIKKGKT